MNLSLLTVTRGEPHTPYFFRHMRAVADMLGAEFVVACDGCDPAEIAVTSGADTLVPVRSSGAIEDVLIEAHRACSGRYVLRLDDDETLSPKAILELTSWLAQGDDSKVYAFPRANLWGDRGHAIVNGDLFPDFQTRLMPRDSETRTSIHQGLPTDMVFTGMILHHKFLVKSPEERREVAARYESKQPGCGTGHYLQFSVPEDCFGAIETIPVTIGELRRSDA